MTRVIPTLGITLAALLLAACGGGDHTFHPPKPGDGLIFAYPADGMVDVPTGSKAIFTFSNKVDQSAVTSDCTDTNNDLVPEGAFCLVQVKDDGTPEAVVSTSSHVSVTNNGRSIQLDTSYLKENQKYQVWLRPSADPSAVNLHADKPLLSFRTRNDKPLPDAAPAVLAINQEDPKVFKNGVQTGPKLPFMDFSPIRLTFTEPLNQDTVKLGDSIKLMHIDPATGDATPVDVDMLNQGSYITLDPVNDLTPGDRYEVRMTSAIKDENNQSLQTPAGGGPLTYVFYPQDSREGAGLIHQRLNTQPAQGEPGFPATSRLTGLKLNQFSLENPIIGKNTTAVIDTTATADMASPKVYQQAIPIVIRKGQKLTITGINPIVLGGAVKTDLNTGNVIGTFATDAVGYMTKNPFRSPGFQPDDQKAPLYAYLDFDLTMASQDPAGNASLNQTLMHVRAVGAAQVKDGELQFEVFRTLSLSVLGGSATIKGDMALSMETAMNAPLPTNDDAPEITGALPRDEEQNLDGNGNPIPADLLPNKNILLTLSEPADPSTLDGNLTLLQMPGGTSVPIHVREAGTTVIITPDSPLQQATKYELQVGAGITDTDPNNPQSIQFASDDALGGDQTLVFHTADLSVGGNPTTGPLALGVYPGVGCALTGALPASDPNGPTAGRCVGGKTTDDQYAPFTYTVGRKIQAVFSKPMDRSSFTLPTASEDCSNVTGSFQLLHVDSNGSCLNIVRGTIKTGVVDMEFVPETPLVAGEHYKMIMNTAADGATSCAAGEVCGANGYPLNTDPLNGDNSSHAGGPNLVINFTAQAPTDLTPNLVRTRNWTDKNGNGYKDAGENSKAVPGRAPDSNGKLDYDNSALVKINGYGGNVSSASVSPGTDPHIYLSGALPLAIAPGNTADLAEAGFQDQGNNQWCVPHSDPDYQYNFQYSSNKPDICVTLANDQQLEVPVWIQQVQGTSIQLDATINAGGIIPISLTNQDTGAVIMRVRDPVKSRPLLYGYIVNVQGESKPQFIAKLDAYMDAPDLSLPAGATTDLHSKPAATWVMGPISFLKDGRIQLRASNMVNVNVRTNISATGTSGYVDMQIPKGKLLMTVTNRPVHARTFTQ